VSKFKLTPPIDRNGRSHTFAKHGTRSEVAQPETGAPAKQRLQPQARAPSTLHYFARPAGGIDSPPDQACL